MLTNINDKIDTEYYTHCGTYYLNEDKSVVPCDIKKWSEQFARMTATNNRHVGDDLIDDIWVSTVWLGADHGGIEGKPLLFETMVFPSQTSPREIYCDRYSTWDEAVQGHKKAVQWVKDGCKDEV